MFDVGDILVITCGRNTGDIAFVNLCQGPQIFASENENAAERLYLTCPVPIIYKNPDKSATIMAQKHITIKRAPTQRILLLLVRWGKTFVCLIQERRILLQNKSIQTYQDQCFRFTGIRHL